MAEHIESKKVVKEAIIKPEARVAPEEFYRAVKENLSMKELAKR